MMTSILLLLVGVWTAGSDAWNISPIQEVAAEDPQFLVLLRQGLSEFFWNAGFFFSENGRGALPDLTASAFFGHVGLLATGGYVRTKFQPDMNAVLCGIDKGVITIDVPLRLNDFEAGYRLCELKVEGVSGKYVVKSTNLTRNSLQARLQYTKKEKNCELKLVLLEFGEFGGLESQAAASSDKADPFQGGLGTLAGWIVGRVEDSLKEIVMTRIREAIEQTAKGKEGNVCALFPV